jgi:aromatic-L-amino-acid decarboxylase
MYMAVLPSSAYDPLSERCELFILLTSARLCWFVLCRCCQHCADIVAGMATVPGAEVLWAPTLNQGLVRFLDTTMGDAACVEDHNRRTAAVMNAVNASGEAFFSGTTWRGMYAVRVSVVNWRTSTEDVKRTVAAVHAAAAAAATVAL